MSSVAADKLRQLLSAMDVGDANAAAKGASINNSVNSLVRAYFFGGVQSCSSSRRETNGGTD